MYQLPIFTSMSSIKFKQRRMKNWFSRLLVGCTFTVGSAFPFVTAVQPVLADVSFPANQAVSQLQQSQIPILLPSSLPGSDAVYLSSSGGVNSYEVAMTYTPDCGGTYCYIGSIQGERGGQFETPWEGTTSQWVQLAQGNQGLFINACGAYCTATLSWQSNNVLYTVTLKNGLKEDLVQIANSAIQAGPRTVTAMSSSSASGNLILSEQGTLNARSSVLSDGSFYQAHSFQGRAGETVLISMTSDEFDAYLFLGDGDGNTIADNDDAHSNTLNSEISVQLPYTGSYMVLANAYEAGQSGNYRLVVQRITGDPVEVRSVSWVIFDPPSNVRVTPNGEVQCTIREVRAVNFYGWSGEWAETDACGGRGYIHTSQIESVD